MKVERTKMNARKNTAEVMMIPPLREKNDTERFSFMQKENLTIVLYLEKVFHDIHRRKMKKNLQGDFDVSFFH